MSRSAKAVEVGVAVVVTVFVALTAPADIEELSCASLVVASFARLASTPVPAASPITAADKRAMIHDRMKTRIVQPHIVPLDDCF